MNRAPSPWYAELRKRLTSYFDESELQSLSFDLGLDYEELSGDTKSEKVIELIQATDQRGKIDALLTKCAELRPNIDWNPLRRAAVAEPLIAPIASAPVAPVPIIEKRHEQRQSKPAVLASVVAGAILIGLAIVAVVVSRELFRATPTSPAANSEATTAATTASTAIPDVESATNSAAGQRYTVAFPDDDYRVKSNVYRVLSASAQPHGSEQVLLTFEIRMTNNGSYPANLWGKAMRLIEDGVSRASTDDWSSTCNKAVDSNSAQECSVGFVISDKAKDLKLRFFDQDAEAIVPLTVTAQNVQTVATVIASTATRSVDPSAASSTSQGYGVTYEDVELKINDHVYNILSISAQPYANDEVLLTLTLRMTNNGRSPTNLWGRTTRIIEDDVPRAPTDDWVNTCNKAVDGSSAQECTVEFVVSNKVKDLKLQIFEQDAEAIAPLTLNVIER